MKLALLSDVHGNLHALDACIAHAKAQGADKFALLGDLVGYGASPAQVVDRCQQLYFSGNVVLRGNHEEMLKAHQLADADYSHAENNSKVFLRNASLGTQTAAWTYAQLTPAQRYWLETLPLTAQEQNVWMVHASADSPEQWRYVEDERTARISLEAACSNPHVRYVFGGHVHHQSLYYRGTGRQLMSFKPTAGVAIPTPSHRRWLATIGSVGQPRDGDTRAMYALFDSTAEKLTFHRIAYDHMAAAQSIRKAGLPEFFAHRLEMGR
ncbi:MAG: metallophosphoesterase family protein [Burkholderiales bacterium]|nr:metallophosphoesterase family protein [Burkholderiales bacterium]